MPLNIINLVGYVMAGNKNSFKSSNNTISELVSFILILSYLKA
jgi:hypothetical protein